MNITLKPIGFVHTDCPREQIPRHWSVSEVEGRLEIEKKYEPGLQDIQAGQQLMVIFYFDRSPQFTPELLTQTPPHRTSAKGVFSICSPVRPNPIGLSVVEVLEVNHNVIWVKGLDMLDGTPILDLKPYVKRSEE